jgi:hypothetical protein
VRARPRCASDLVVVTGSTRVGLGPDADTTTAFLVGQMQWLLEKFDDAGTRRAEANLRKVIVAHAAEDGVRLGSDAWIVTARR